MKRKLPILLMILILAATGCAESRQVSSADKQKVPSTLPKAHSISKAGELQMLSDARRDLQVIAETTDTTAPLQTALVGAALKETITKFASDKAAGQVKIRRYDRMSLKLENYTKGIGGVTVVFTDNSYVIDKNTKKVLKKPAGRQLKVLLALKKVKGRWKIIRILSQEVKAKKSG